MSSKRKDNPGKFVSIAVCDERFARIMDKLTVMDKKIDTITTEKKEKGRDWRLLGFAILGSVISGLIVVGATYLLQTLP